MFVCCCCCCCLTSDHQTLASFQFSPSNCFVTGCEIITLFYYNRPLLRATYEVILQKNIYCIWWYSTTWLFGDESTPLTTRPGSYWLCSGRWIYIVNICAFQIIILIKMLKFDFITGMWNLYFIWISFILFSTDVTDIYLLSNNLWLMEIYSRVICQF